MAKKKNSGKGPAPVGANADLVPNVSLNRKVRTGEPTEDELLLESPRRAAPQAREPSQAAFRQSDPWRVLRITSEFVHAFDALAEVGAAVTIFGSARTPASDPMFQSARELAFKLSQRGFAVITGGGPGIMEAANQGAREAAGFSIGLNIELPHEQGMNRFIDVPVNFRYFFCRKTAFVKYSMGFILFPGGFGTLDELFEAVTLIQTRKIKRFPVVLFGSAYWQGLIDWLRSRVLAEGKIDSEDLTLFRVTDSTDEACEHLADCYSADCWDNPPAGQSTRERGERGQ
jgi:uncharacterized protein (TIGR00730 family)